MFESPGLPGFVSDLECLWSQVQGHMLESSCLSGYRFEPQVFVSPLKEQVLASAGLLVTSCIANVSVGVQDFVTPLKEQVLASAGLLVTSRIANVTDGVEVISGSHAAAAISGELYACSRKAVQVSGRVDVQSGVLKGNEEEESKPPCVAACFPQTNVTGLHTRTKDTSTSIPVQASSYSVFVRSFTGSTMVLYVSPLHDGVCVGANHCRTLPDPATFVLSHA